MTIQEGRLVKRTLTALKQRLEESDNKITMQAEEGYIYQAKCIFHSPASEEEIRNFEQQTRFILPHDYKEFLKITNGCRLFTDIEYGGEIELYSLSQIIEFNEHYDDAEGYYDIAYIYQDNIVINGTRYAQNEKNYLFWKGHVEQFDEVVSLNMNFELWFDRFVVSQGSKFWWWPLHTAENYDELSQAAYIANRNFPS